MTQILNQSTLIKAVIMDNQIALRKIVSFFANTDIYKFQSILLKIVTKFMLFSVIGPDEITHLQVRNSSTHITRVPLSTFNANRECISWSTTRRATIKWTLNELVVRPWLNICSNQSVFYSVLSVLFVENSAYNFWKFQTKNAPRSSLMTSQLILQTALKFSNIISCWKPT